MDGFLPSLSRYTLIRQIYCKSDIIAKLGEYSFVMITMIESLPFFFYITEVGTFSHAYIEICELQNDVLGCTVRSHSA